MQHWEDVLHDSKAADVQLEEGTHSQMHRQNMPDRRQLW